MTRILTLDIETSPHMAYAFNVWQTNILPNALLQPTYMLSWAAKWLGDPKKKTVYRMFEDKDSLSTLHEMICEADIIVSYNGEKFDMRHIHREFVENGLSRPRPNAHVDMLKVVKKMFNFPHNRLDYIADVLLGEKKLETGGFSLWPEFMEGLPKARKTMKKYNIQDVVITEKLYHKLRGWIPNHPFAGGVDMDMGDSADDYTCATCGSGEITLHRPRRTRCFAIRTLQCNECDAWADGKRRKLT
jgi:DNA polymerase elongation subunit (family B)